MPFLYFALLGLGRNLNTEMVVTIKSISKLKLPIGGVVNSVLNVAYENVCEFYFIFVYVACTIYF